MARTVATRAEGINVAFGASCCLEMYAFRAFDRVSDIPREAWDTCFPGEAECHAYYVACEATDTDCPDDDIVTGAVCLKDADEIVAVAPVFRLNYALHTSVQGKLRGVLDKIAARVPGRLSFSAFCVGSPYTERCHVGFKPDLSPDQRVGAAHALVDGVREYAKRLGIGLVGWKDLASPDERTLRDALEAEGFARINGLPVAVLDLPYANETAYLASLSSATRKDIRRKLARSSVRIETRSDINGIEAEIAALYESTRQRSAVDYDALETLPNRYFEKLSDALGERVIFQLYWVGSTLAAFNLLLVEQDRLIDKFLGMHYPLAREHDIYAISWMANVRLCLERRIGHLQTGQTAYASKLRFGSRLDNSAIYFRHGRFVLDKLLRMAAPWIAFDRNDPDLRRLRTGRPS